MAVFIKGHEKVGGRKVGSVNKTPAAVKAVLHECFDRLGGIDAMVKWATDNPTEFYKLWSKMLPKELTGENGGPIQFTREDFARLGTDELIAFYAAVRRIAERPRIDAIPAS